jgi:octaprenyl-diphosphate synthase
MTIKDILELYKDDLHAVEDKLDNYYKSYTHLIPQITDHIIHSGGKRIRPLLLIIAADLCGYHGDRRFTIAAVMEFLHTASLLHDDVIDHAETRRGRTAANKIWGNPASVLVGDYLYSQAFKLMVDDGDPAVQRLLTQAAITMVEGETTQLIKCGDTTITEEEYIRVIEQKTAILISASCGAGALLAHAPDTHVAALNNFGLNLGVAFQVTDDTLDYVAEEEEFGKAIGMDLKEGKITLPLIRALANCTPEEKAFVRDTLDSSNVNDDTVTAIRAMIEKHDGIKYALTKAANYIIEGQAFLDLFEDSPPKRALVAISDYILKRRL